PQTDRPTRNRVLLRLHGAEPFDHVARGTQRCARQALVAEAELADAIGRNGCLKGVAAASAIDSVERDAGGVERVVLDDDDFASRQKRREIGRAHVELQSRENLVCRLLLEKKKK